MTKRYTIDANNHDGFALNYDKLELDEMSYLKHEKNIDKCLMHEENEEPEVPPQEKRTYLDYMRKKNDHKVMKIASYNVEKMSEVFGLIEFVLGISSRFTTVTCVSKRARIMTLKFEDCLKYPVLANIINSPYALDVTYYRLGLMTQRIKEIT